MKCDGRIHLRRHEFKLLCIVVFGIVWFVARRKQGNGDPNKPIPSLACGPDHPQATEDTQQHNVDAINSYLFPHENIRVFKDYFGLEEKVEQRTPRDVPVIATAASSNHFTESLLMLENVQTQLFPYYSTLRVYYYDIGLTDRQRQRVMEYPRVELRQFPFSKVPAHVGRLKGYAWKPIIIQMLLREFGFVMWMDASVRFTGSNQNRLFQAAKSHGVIYRPGFYSVVIHTDLDTFTFLKEDPCLFSKQNEIEANFMLVYKTQFTNDFFMKPLVLCALSFGCLVTESSDRMLDCTDKTRPHTCHRFDQSVFTILISRLFGSEKRFQLPEYSEIHLCRGIEVSLVGETLNRMIIRFAYWLTSTPDICFE